MNINLIGLCSVSPLRALQRIIFTPQHARTRPVPTLLLRLCINITCILRL